jgi:hypothetical protein
LQLLTTVKDGEDCQICVKRQRFQSYFLPTSLLQKRINLTFPQTIYALGGRNFLLANVVNYGCIPESTASNGGNCSARETTQSAAFGASYQLLLDTFRADVADATLLLLDIWNASTPSASGRSRLGMYVTRRGSHWLACMTSSMS